jgi:hypothetical protein
MGGFLLNINFDNQIINDILVLIINFTKKYEDV